MSKQKEVQPQQGDVHYRRAKTWQIALSQLNGGANMCFYILFGMVSYLANAGYGIAVVISGIIITASRLFDGITDPIIAVVIDRFNSKFGKIRIMLMIGWLIEAIAVFIMFIWGSNGHFGLVFFIASYALYIIGYTINGVTGNIIAPVMVTDPKQRPTINVWATVYAYFVPMVVSTIITVVLLPKYSNVYSVQMLAVSALFCVGVAFVLNLLACVGVTEIDKPENFKGVSATSDVQKIGLKDMVQLLKGNKPLQTFIIAAAADKLAYQTGGQAIVSTMLYGILIGNMQLGFILSVVAMLPSIVFVIIGAKHAGKVGNKESMVFWTIVSIGVAMLGILFCTLTDMRQVTVAIIPTILFFILTLGLNGTKMCISAATGSMRADVIDYELSRSGKYLPGSVSATYSFIDKSISALGSTIAAAGVALIGYTHSMPQPTDEKSTAIVGMTIFLYFGVPIIGWVLSLFAMKFYHLTKAEMVNVQQKNHAIKQSYLEQSA